MPAETRPLRIAVVQPTLADGDRDANLRKITALVRSHGADHDILVLPETCTSGFASVDDVQRLAEPRGGPTATALAALSREYGVLIVAGLAERAPEGLYNTAAVIGPDGLLGTYRKTHLWLADRDKFLPGDGFTVLSWKGVKIAPLICFDIEFPETARAVAALGAELVLVCNGNMEPFAPQHRIAAAARALENQVFVAMANRTGTGRVDTFAGGSVVAGPDGRIISEAGTEETLLSAAIDLSEIATARQAYEYLSLRRIALSLETLAPGGEAPGLRIPEAPA